MWQQVATPRPLCLAGGAREESVGRAMAGCTLTVITWEEGAAFDAAALPVDAE